MYMQRALIYPQLGKEREMQQHLESWVRMRQDQGRKVGLAMQLFSPEGVVFVLTVRHDDLAAYEQQQQRNRADPAFQDFIAKNTSLSRHSSRIELLEVLVPLPS